MAASRTRRPLTVEWQDDHHQAGEPRRRAPPYAAARAATGGLGGLPPAGHCSGAAWLAKPAACPEAAVAGQPPPLYCDPHRGRLVPVSGHGPALGLEPEWRGPTERWRLAPKDALMLYTDGVLDAKWNERERLGEARLAELLS